MKKNKSSLSDQELDRVGKALRPYLTPGQKISSPASPSVLPKSRAAIASLIRNPRPPLQSWWRARYRGWVPLTVERLALWATGLGCCCLAIVRYQQWSDYVTARDTADVDVMLLADDVPVDAFARQRFLHFCAKNSDPSRPSPAPGCSGRERQSTRGRFAFSRSGCFFHLRRLPRSGKTWKPEEQKILRSTAGGLGQPV